MPLSVSETYISCPKKKNTKLVSNLGVSIEQKREDVEKGKTSATPLFRSEKIRSSLDISPKATG